MPSAGSRRQQLRVGFVNINGLGGDKWARLVALLNSTFDFLFLAETWYVDHASHLRDRCLLASTQPPPSLRGRPKGGLYLLATASGRGRVTGEVLVTRSAITFQVDRHVISGVYSPPSQLDDDLSSLLDTLSSSTVILGDVNARFPWLAPLQSGKPGPSSRVRVFRSFLDRYPFRTLRPEEAMSGLPPRVRLEKQLTVDHCFVRNGLQAVQLALLAKSSFGLVTDHKYVLHLRIDGRRQVPGHDSTIRRYRIGLLARPDVASAACSLFDREALAANSLLLSGTDPDEVHAALVSILQRVCERVLGRNVGRRVREAVGPMPDRQTSAESVRLYKLAAVDSEENAAVLPSEDGRRRGISALAEVSSSLSDRYAALEPFEDGLWDAAYHCGDDSSCSFAQEDLVREVVAQDGNKACGSDGVHIRLIKALLPTALPRILCRLFNLCLSAGATPRAWNLTDIHLITKDLSKPRDVANVRPITFICIHRKLFERLLLLRYFDVHGWARIHPTQAGFRGDCSAITNAALVHHLLSGGAVTLAAFIDFEKAFDVVDHSRLAGLLLDRRCPLPVYRIICSLTFSAVSSTVLVNSEASAPFPRTRGVLQGSPISPFLFNIYIDGLICTLNSTADPGVPRCLFYADDGVLLARDPVTLQTLADILARWSAEASIGVNIQKCGLVSRLAEGTCPDITIAGRVVPRVQSYLYLGFPVVAAGIDFVRHLEGRMASAAGRVSFLRRHSDRWGPAHRLRIYRQYLAPMFEYGAPLVSAWIEGQPANRDLFERATQEWKGIVAWIAGCSPDGYASAANLCGLSPLYDRFRQLCTSFQYTSSRSLADDPLAVARSTLLPQRCLGVPFAVQLQRDQGWVAFCQQYPLA